MEDLLSKSISENFNLPKTEEAILELWETLDAFHTSLELSKGREPYKFYDGPPFATGLPHYGHILAGTIKDVVTRYAHQTNHYVSRRFGWDCHGLPVEFEIDKKLGIKSSKDVEKMGIAKGIVSRYCKEWRTIVTRLGRWIDFDNDYRTMEPWYMESVWNVFKKIYEKGRVYKGFRVMPYSTACTTPLSNFEAGSNYKDVSDPAVIVSFPLVENNELSFLAWTTTPWTLPSNLALCVNESFDYVQILEKKSNKRYILAKCRLPVLYPKMTKKDYKNDEFMIESTMKGSDLKGKKYIPLFDYFKDWPNAFKIVCDNYVTDDSGVGIVHIAPGFGEDDFRVSITNQIIVKGGKVACPLDVNGCFTSEVPDYEGKGVKESDEPIIEDIKKRGRLVNRSQIVHSYPYCWRSETPLIYRTIDSWFVRVEDMRDELLKASGVSDQKFESEGTEQKTRWVPNLVKNRFNQWLADARDWNISRNRYWGTPIPIWTSDNGEEIVVIGSIKELEEKTGKTITDIHRESIDDLTIPSTQGNGLLHRIPEVFDCWFESGSMPYAQVHYPFDVNDETFLKNNFPADFIAEGLDQTRGWFYTLLVLSTSLFGVSAFNNVIVNGLVLAENGLKMSKKEKNYPDPVLCINQHGADAIRLYLINSPAVRAEPLKFQEKGLVALTKEVLLPWYNAFRFLNECISKYENDGSVFQPKLELAEKSTNIMDRWLLDLIVSVRKEMTEYRLYAVLPKLMRFIEQLTNIYVRLNRKRCKTCDSEGLLSLYCLYETLFSLSRLMAPFVPFLSEFYYQKLRIYHQNYKKDELPLDTVGRSPSVHYLMIPGETDYSQFDDPLLRIQMSQLVNVLELGRNIRDNKNISLKMPVKEIIVISEDEQVLKNISELSNYVKSELNILNFAVDTDTNKWCSFNVAPDFKALGLRLGKNSKVVQAALKNITKDQVQSYREKGEVEIAGHKIIEKELIITKKFTGDEKKYSGASADDNTMVVALNITSDPTLVLMAISREFTSVIQKYRKELHLKMIDRINIYYHIKNDPKGKFIEMINTQGEFLESTLLSQPKEIAQYDEGLTTLGKTDASLSEGIELEVTVCKLE